MNDRERLEAIVKVVRQYLPPDGVSIKEAMGKIIELVDPLPPKKEWVGLTDEEIEDAMDYWSDDEHSDFGGAYQADGEYFNVRASWRYIEAKLKEKNSG